MPDPILLPQLQVTGTIMDTFGKPVSNIRVIAFDKDLRSETLLGEAMTNTAGEYKISYNSLIPILQEAKTADILIRVFAADNSIIGESGVFFNAKPSEPINLTVNIADEFSTLAKMLEPLSFDKDRKPIAFKDLREDDEFNDINFLASETERDTAIIKAFVKAHQLADEAGKIMPPTNRTLPATIPAAFFYALLRKELPADLQTIFRTPNSVLKQKLATAAEENIVSKKIAANFDNIANLIHSLLAYDIVERNGTASDKFKKTIANLIPDISLQKKFVEIYSSTAEEPEKFWDKLKEQPGFTDGKAIEKVKTLLHLNKLTGNQPELANTLYQKRLTDSSLEKISGFAQFTKKDWKNFITETHIADFPAGITGKTEDEKIENYATSLENLMQMLYPVEFFTKRLEKDTSSHWADLKPQLVTFLNKNKSFNLNTNTIKKEFEHSDFSDISDKNGVIKELKKINRLYKLSDKQEHVSALLNAGIDSAVGLISKFTPIQFVKQFSSVFESVEAANEYYNKANSSSNKATAVAQNLMATFGSDNPAAMKMVPRQNEMNDVFKELFRPDGLCECEHCMSLYSPAAYFVNTLKFLKDHHEAAFDRLTVERRPDLVNINLTCQNTNTPLPYIDLVNELLENKIAGTSEAYQTEGNAAEIEAMPEHMNPAAYANLEHLAGNTVLSSALPLHLPLEELRLYLDKLGYKRHDLMELFYGKKEPGRYRDTVIAAEYLAFAPGEIDILNEGESFGIELPGTIADLIIKLGISYVDLLHLLETYFLNPDRLLTIVAISDDPEKAATCDLNELKLSGGDALWLDKAIRFVRLWRKLRWEMFDIDRFFTAFAITDFTDFENKNLIPLSQVVRIQTRLNLPVRKILALITNIDTVLYHDHSKEGQPEINSMYRELFRNKAMLKLYDVSTEEQFFPADFIVIKNKDFDEYRRAGNDQSTLIAAALGMSLPELLSLTNLTGNDKFLQTVSSVYRIKILTDALRISQSELAAFTRFIYDDESAGLLNFIQTNVFENPEKIILFLDDWTFFKSMQYNPVELNDLLVKRLADEQMISAIRDVIENLNRCLADFESIEAREVGLASIPDENERKQKEEELKRDYYQTLENLYDFLNGELVKTSLSQKLYDGEEAAIQSIWAALPLNDKDRFLKLLNEEVQNGIKQLAVVFKTVNAVANAPILFKRLGFELAEIVFLIETKSLFGLTVFVDPISMPPSEKFAALKKLFRLAFLKKELRSTTGFIELFNSLIKKSGSGEVEINSEGKFEFLTRLNQLTVPQINYVDFLASLEDANGNKIFFSDAVSQDYFSTELLLSAIVCGRVIGELTNNPNDMLSFIKTEITGAEADSVFKILKLKYEEQWPAVIKPISDKLRTRRRDALVAYLVAVEDNSWYSTNDIFNELLIDTEMDACMITSRIKQAISSIQHFVNRCLMGLEERISLGEGFAVQWNTWRERYRVWEANRKIFLYPENWLEPELRDDKSPFFKEFESKLLQNEVAQETSEDAMREYLQKLDEVSNLEVSAIYQENIDEYGLKNIVHVLGRTTDLPHRFFYRRQINKRNPIEPNEENGIWTPWEKVDLDIEGDHIVLIVTNKKVMLYWAIPTQKQDNSDNTKVPASGDPMPTGVFYWETKIASSEYKDGRWRAKKLLKKKINRYIDPEKTIFQVRDNETNIEFVFKNVYNDYFLLGQDIFQLENNLSINNHLLRPGNRGPIQNGDDENGFSVIGGTHFGSAPSSPPGTIFRQGKIIENGSDALTLHRTGIIGLRSLDQPNRKTLTDTLFKKTPGLFQITPSPIENNQLNIDPFIYNDINGSFLVKPSLLPFNVSDGDPLTLSNYSKQYTFHVLNFSFANHLSQTLNSDGIDGLYAKNIQNRPDELIFTDLIYLPQPVINNRDLVRNYDFTIEGADSLYNWEVFFHIPLLIATRLSQNQKFDEARKWFHYLFNPTVSSNEEGIKRFWITKPFYELAKNFDNLLTIEEVLDPDKNPDLQKQVQYWEENPFKPHAVARMRVAAYMRTVVMKYIDNLIAWGDSLFRQDTLESINEATLLYVLAGNILGKRPEKIPQRAIAKVHSFSSLPDIDPLGNAKVEIESFITPSASNNEQPDILENYEAESTTPERGNLKMPLFCIPKNDKLISYWDKIEDRLFKIRHCQDIEGSFRQRSLFGVPIDPGLLVRAAAAGLDIANVLREGNYSLPNYRFNIMLAKANELCNDVKGLGNVLLSAMEKKDAEQLSLIRSGHELSILKAMKDIKQKQRDEAEENLNSLNKSKETVEFRKEYYSTRKFRNSSEEAYFYLTQSANVIESGLAFNSALASLQYLIPQTNIGPWIMGTEGGGISLGNATMAALEGGHALATSLKLAGEVASTKGTYERRADEWKFQGQSADLDLKQIEKQILAAEIRLAIAERDLEIHEQQIENTKEIDEFMRGKFTNKELYSWMVEQVSLAYFQSYQLAFDIAKKAEKCMQYELGIEGTNYIQYGYWDSLKGGLLSGERLQYDLRRLENAYMEQNVRDFEITKHVSLAIIDPLALLVFKKTGKCSVHFSEELFDLDFPGHYFRRIKSVSLSIPCVAGPYTSVNATLRLITNEYRKDTTLENGYRKMPDEVNGAGRFRVGANPISAIATSNAQMDSGVFELNFRDERYLPFEGAGAISKWEIELSEDKDLRQFNYSTISDVIFHIRYTAKEAEDDGSFKSEAIGHVKEFITAKIDDLQAPFIQFFNLKQEFSTAWHRFLHPSNGAAQELVFNISKERFPFFAQHRTVEVEEIELFVIVNPGQNFDVNLKPGSQNTSTMETVDEKPDMKRLIRKDITDLTFVDNNEVEIKVSLKPKDTTDDNPLVINPDEMKEMFMIIKYHFKT